MTDERRLLLQSAVRKLGPERCEHALIAFGPKGGRSWTRCALSYAYGPPGALCMALANYQGFNINEGVGILLGLTTAETEAISEVHTHINYFTDWLELRAMFEGEASKAQSEAIA